MSLVLCEGPGEGLLELLSAREAALSRPGEGTLCLKSGETILCIRLGDVAIEMTGEGGVNRGSGVDTALTSSADVLVSWLSGVVMVSLLAVERSETSSGLWEEPSTSGVEPLLNRSGRETLPLSSGKGDDD